MNETAKKPNPFACIIASLLEGVENTASLLAEQEEAASVAEELNHSLPLIRQLREWLPTLPEDRMRESIMSLFLSLDTILRRAVKQGTVDPSWYDATNENPIPAFLKEALIQCGPEITVSKDCMSARIQIQKEFQNLWSVETLKSGLERQGIVFGINETALQKALKNSSQSWVVAKGKDAVEGRDAQIEDCLNLMVLDGRPTITSGGQADFKHPHQYRNISKGQVILNKIPATEGEPGMDIYGEIIPAKDGVNLLFPTVPNTEISEDELSMYAIVDGCCYFEGDQLVIVPGLEIENNVDYSTGNLNVDVAVTVKGDVLSGFKVVSDTDIAVKGTVEAAELAAKGHLFLEGGVQGKGEAQLRSHKHIYAKFVNSAQAATHGDVRVDGSVWHSKIRCRRLLSTGKNAEIVGGHIEVVDDLCAGQLGSEMGVKTKIVVGYDVEHNANESQNIEEELGVLHEKQEKLNEKYTKLQTAKQESGSLNEKQQEAFQSIQKTLPKLDEKIGKWEKKLETIRDEIEQAKQFKRMVRARSTIYPGVEIVILGYKKTFTVPTGPASIALVGEEIELLPFEERSFVEEDDVN